jgi:hypothetical protein
VESVKIFLFSKAVGFSYTLQKRGVSAVQSVAAEILAYYSDAKTTEMASENFTPLLSLEDGAEVEY